MDFEMLQELVSKIPELEKVNKNHIDEIRSLKQVITDLSNDEVMDSKAVQLYTGYHIEMARLIMTKCGASLQHGKKWVRKSDLIKYLMSNKQISQDEIHNKAIEHLQKMKLQRIYNKANKEH